MSSTTYSAELRPDPILRRIVLLFGGGLSTTGAVLIVTLPLHVIVLLLGCVAWLIASACELRNIRLGFRRCLCLRLTADGGVLVLDLDGDWQPARLLPGSVVLGRIAWIRVVDSQGRICAELLRGNGRKSHDWRRLQVIWRHIGGTL